MTRQQSINAKCKDCIYDPLAGGTWRQQAENCTVTSCSLYPYRPVSKPRKITLHSVTTAQVGPVLQEARP